MALAVRDLMTHLRSAAEATNADPAPSRPGIARRFLLALDQTICPRTRQP